MAGTLTPRMRRFAGSATWARIGALKVAVERRRGPSWYSLGVGAAASSGSLIGIARRPGSGSRATGTSHRSLSSLFLCAFSNLIRLDLQRRHQCSILDLSDVCLVFFSFFWMFYILRILTVWIYWNFSLDLSIVGECFRGIEALKSSRERSLLKKGNDLKFEKGFLWLHGQNFSVLPIFFFGWESLLLWSVYCSCVLLLWMDNQCLTFQIS